MAISLRNTYTAYAASVGSVAVTAGDLIIVFGSTQTGALSVSDNAAGGSNNYSLAQNAALAAPARGKLWYAVAKATESLTVTIADGSDLGLSVHVVIGNWDLATALHVSDQDLDTGILNTHVSPTLATLVSAAYLISCWFQEESASVQTSNDAFVKRTEQSDHVHTTLDRIVSATGSYSNSVQAATAGFNFGSIIAAFIEDAGDAPENLSVLIGEPISGSTEFV